MNDIEAALEVGLLGSRSYLLEMVRPGQARPGVLGGTVPSVGSGLSVQPEKCEFCLEKTNLQELKQGLLGPPVPRQVLLAASVRAATVPLVTHSQLFGGVFNAPTCPPHMQSLLLDCAFSPKLFPLLSVPAQHWARTTCLLLHSNKLGCILPKPLHFWNSAITDLQVP